MSVFYLDRSACFLKLANNNGVAGYVGQTDVLVLKMGRNFFSVGRVRLVNISKSGALSNCNKRLCSRYMNQMPLFIFI